MSVINMGSLALPLDVTWQNALSNSILIGLAMKHNLSLAQPYSKIKDLTSFTFFTFSDKVP